MAGFNDAAGNMAFLKSKFNKNIAAGEKSMATEFEMTIEEYPEVAVRVRSTQMPGMGRADVEDFGPMGLGITQQGPLENKGEIAVTCVETLQGPIIGMLREVVRDKKYLTVKIQMTPESLEGKAPDAHKFRLLHCKLRSDPVDLSTEDTAALVKPAFTITYNWVEL